MPGFRNDLGSFANEAAALADIQLKMWDSNGDGTGAPRNGMFFYDSTLDVVKTYTAGAWYQSSGLEQVTDALSDPTGFPSRTDATLSFVDGGGTPRTFTITPTGATFEFWVMGVKHEKAAQSIQIPNTEGLHFIYFDGAGDIQTTMTFSRTLLTENALASIVYWDVSAAAHIYFAEERHGPIMSGATHLDLHLSRGTFYEEGLALGNFDVDQSGALDSHAQCDCANGEIDDEDIDINIADGSPQDLTPVLTAPVLHKSGAGGDWNRDAATAFPCKRFGGAARLAWNDPDGGGAGVWGQTEVANNRYCLSHIFATNDLEFPIVVVQGQGDYGNIVAARTGANDEINNLVITGLPFAEFLPIGTIIFQTGSGYGNTVKALVRSTDLGDDYVDWRRSKISPSGSPVSHADLSGLGEDDHPQYQPLVGRAAEALTMGAGSAFFCRQVTDAGMAATDGTLGEIVFNLNDNRHYSCSVTGTPATWRIMS